jgi:hypothetical protein
MAQPKKQKSLVSKPNKAGEEATAAMAAEKKVHEAPKEERDLRPVLMMEEFVRSYVNYKPQHLAPILAFCNSRGLPTRATEEELAATLSSFGWPASLRRRNH